MSTLGLGFWEPGPPRTEPHGSMELNATGNLILVSGFEVWWWVGLKLLIVGRVLAGLDRELLRVKVGNSCYGHNTSSSFAFLCVILFRKDENKGLHRRLDC